MDNNEPLNLTITEAQAVNGLGRLMDIIRRDNERWWIDIHTGKPLDRNVGELLALIHSEISEALEGHRKGLMDDHLPHIPMFEVELADAIIRILDTASRLCPTLPLTIMEKLNYNRHRADHKTENRLKDGGKKY